MEVMGHKRRSIGGSAESVAVEAAGSKEKAHRIRDPVGFEAVSGEA
jgi:hypothetical protein